LQFIKVHSEARIMAYRYPEKINYKNYFQFRKDFITAGNSLWRDLPLSTKSIYPVIGCHADANGKAALSQQTIADLCGCTAKTVREGVRGLLSIPWVKLQNQITKRGERQKRYIIRKGSKETEYFSFFKAILESGIWREISTQYNSKAAHAIYCVCLAYSFFDFDLYRDLEEVNCEINEFWKSDEFTKRSYDFLSADLEIIAFKAGVSLPTARKAVQALIDVELLEEFTGSQVWKIYRCPKAQYSHEHLNSCLKVSQPKETDFMKGGGLGAFHKSKTKKIRYSQFLPTKK